MKYIFLIIMVCWVIGINGQKLTQTIRGRVTDKESYMPLPGANIIVAINGETRGTITDEEGYFVLTDIPVGRYNIQVSYVGYEPQVVPETEVRAGKEVILNIGLRESVNQINEAVIKARIRKDIPLNSMAITSARSFSVDEAHRYAGGFDDPARLVTGFAGVSSGLLEDNGIVVRGNAPKGILWRLEGVEIPNPNHFANMNSYGGGGITAFSSQMLTNSDFYTGAFPAEYGNAISGVFDMRLKEGNPYNFEHTFQASLMGIDFASEGPLFENSNASYLFNYRYSTFSLIKVFLPEEANIPVYQDLSFKFNFPTAKAGVFSLWAISALDEITQDTDEDTTLWKYYEDLQTMDAKVRFGALGFNHKFIAGDNSYIQTSIVATANETLWEESIIDSSYHYYPLNDAVNSTWKYTFSSFINHKFGKKHTNRTGMTVDQLNYNIVMNSSMEYYSDLTEIVNDRNSAFYLHGYSQSKINPTHNITINAGFHYSYFFLNDHSSFEPRLGLKWDFSSKSAIGLGYGKHSQIEPLNYYLIKSPTNPDQTKNKHLDFIKAHHLVLSLDHRVNNHVHLKIEPYYQYLYDVPVIPGTAYSLINITSDWFLDDSLSNDGTGTNYGVDVSLERFFDNGYYYLFSASVFDSKYVGGDGKERDTRYDKDYVVDFLFGKEWAVGKNNKSNLVGVNGRFTYSGGERYTPYNPHLSDLYKEIVEDDFRSFEHKFSALYRFDLTLTYSRNKKNYTTRWAVQIKNLLGSNEQYGYQYNFKEDKVELSEMPIIIPNLSYKIEF